jgi:hypothetical protein
MPLRNLPHPDVKKRFSLLEADHLSPWEKTKQPHQ